MKSKKSKRTSEQLIKRSRVAQQADVCTRTLRRLEQAGILHPVKINSRLTCYPLSEVERWMQGLAASAGGDTSISSAITRTPNGTFSKAAA